MEESIRANRRRIRLSQWAYAALVTGATLLAGFWLLGILRHGEPWTAADSLTIILAILLDGLFLYSAFFMGMPLVRWLTRASEIYPGGFPEVRDALDNLVLASGLPAPQLLFIDSSMRNAFSLRQGERAALFFSHGLADNLDSIELQAVMAHEMAHIASGDADLNAALASLRAFGLGDLQLRARVNSESTWTEIAVAFLPRLLAWGLLALVIALGVLAFISIRDDQAVAGWITVLLVVGVLVALNFVSAAIIGGILGRFADAAREYLADQMAVRWTMDADSLGAAMLKAEEDSYSTRLRFLFNMGFARFERDDPLPGAEERAYRLGSELHMPLDT